MSCKTTSGQQNSFTPLIDWPLIDWCFGPALTHGLNMQVLWHIHNMTNLIVLKIKLQCTSFPVSNKKNIALSSTHCSVFIAAATSYHMFFSICITWPVDTDSSSFRQPHPDPDHSPPGLPYLAHITSSQSLSSFLLFVAPSAFHSRI